MRAAGALAVGLALIAPASAEAAGWSRAATLSPRAAGLDLARGGGQRRRRGRRSPRAAASPPRLRAVRAALVQRAAVRHAAGARARARRRRGDRPGRHRRGGVDRARRRAEGRGAAARRALRRRADARGLRRPAAGGGRGERRGGGDVARTPPRLRRAKAAFGTADGFGAPVPLDTASFAYPVELAFDGSGDLAMAWSAQSVPGSGPTWTVKVIHRAPDGSLGAVQEPASGYAYDVRLARSAAGGTYLSWIGNSGPESGMLGPTQTAIAPAGGGFDAPASPEPKNARTLGARVAAVGDSLLTIYTDAQGAAAGGRAHDRRRLPHAHRADPVGRRRIPSSTARSRPGRSRGSRWRGGCPGGRWARVKPPRGVPRAEARVRRGARDRGRGPARDRRVAGHTRPRARRRRRTLRPPRRAPRGPRR